MLYIVTTIDMNFVSVGQASEAAAEVSNHLFKIDAACNA